MDSKEAREISCFGFTADELCEDASEMIESMIKNTLKDFEEVLISKSKDVSPETIKMQIQELHMLFMEKAKKPMEKFQIAAREIFTIPPEVQVPDGCDEDVEVVSSDQLESLRKEVQELENLFLQKCKESSELKIQAAKFKQVEPISEQNKANLEVFQKHYAKDSGKTCEELFEALKQCEDYFLYGEVGGGGDSTESPLVDKYKLFTKRKK